MFNTRSKDFLITVFAILVFAVSARASIDSKLDSELYQLCLDPGSVPKTTLQGRVKTLIARGADVNARQWKSDLRWRDGGSWLNGKAPIHIASMRSEDFNLVSFLIKHGAKVDIKDGAGHTPLWYAVMANNAHTCSVLINAGADINAETIPLTARESDDACREWASQLGLTRDQLGAIFIEALSLQDELVRFDKTTQYRSGPVAFFDDRNWPVSDWNMLNYASAMSSVEVVAILLEESHNPVLNAADQFGDTPIHFAAQFNSDPKVISLLYENGFDIHQVNNLGQNLLTISTSNSEIKILKHVISLLDGSDSTFMGERFVNKGKATSRFNVHYQGFNGRTALITASRISSASESIEKMTLLLEAGAKIDAKDNSGRTPLIYASMGSDSPEAVMFLIKFGANVSIKDNSGNDALHYAALNAFIMNTKAYWEMKDSVD